MLNSKNNLNDEIVGRLESLGIDLSILSDTLRVEVAHDYLQFGVARRLSIIRLNLLSIFEIAYPNRTEPLNLLEESASLAMHLHSFFYHCYGALDNAAWSVAYELGFLDKEDRWKDHKFEVSFYGKKGLPRWIKERHTHLHSVLNAQEPINDDIKNIRDAIAHRIPLYVPTFITPTQLDEKKQLYSKIEQLSVDDNKRWKLQERADSIGTFKPLFHVEGDPHQQYDIQASSLEISQHLLTILDAVKRALAKGSA